MRRYHKKGQTRTILIIVLGLYLVLLGIFLTLMGATYGSKLPSYTTLQKTIGTGFVLNIVTGVAVMPIALNLIFILIPVGILTWLVVLSVLPTTNAGG